MSGLNIFDMFSTNKGLEEEGQWIELDADVAIKIRAMGSKAVSECREALVKPYAMLIRAGQKIPDDKNEEIGFRVIAEAVIADWRGITNAEGVVVPYSADEAFAIVKALPNFAGFVAGFSAEAQNYKDKLHGDSAKNS